MKSILEGNENVLMPAQETGSTRAQGPYTRKVSCILFKEKTHLWSLHWNAHISFQYSFNDLVLPLCMSGEHPLREQMNQ